MVARVIFALIGLFAGFVTIPLFGIAPELADPLSQENGANRVSANIPFGKTLILPIAGFDGDGDLLDFRVASSNPKVFARMKTGNPILRIQIDYAGDPNAPIPSAPFSGVLEFQLYRDLTPITAGNVGGLAEAGYYNNLVFHRIIPDFVAQGGDPAGNGSGLSDPNDPNSFVGLRYSFDHEFKPSLIFSGRGQLAVANSNGGYERGKPVGSGLIQLGNFSPTNGSQFFITYAQPRHLDFKHTIFGQLLRGFDILDKMATVPRDASDKPTVPVTMTNVSLLPGRSDATLVLSAIGIGSSNITVTATDPSGGQATRSFQVTSVEDTVNDPPVLRPIPNLISPVGKRPTLPLKAFDLEHDYLLYGIATTSGNSQPGSFGIAQITSTFTPRQTAGFQDIAVGVAGLNDPQLGAQGSAAAPFAPFDPYTFQVAEIGYGDRPIEGITEIVQGTEGAPLEGVNVAEFIDADAAGQPSDFTAVVDWGDGTAPGSSSETSAPTVTIERLSTRPGAFVIKGSHTYAHPGIYLVGVIIDAPLGATASVFSHAIISARDATLTAVGRELNHVGPALADRVIATFSDSTSAVRATDFTALIDWGDGDVSPGTIRLVSQGEFTVTGSHSYRDPETFAVQVYVTRIAPTAAQTFAWSTIDLSGFDSGKVLPPFPMPHLVGQISTISVNTQNPQGAQKEFKTTTGVSPASQTYFTCSIVILNSGNKKSPDGKLRFYLSRDEKLNLAPVTNPDSSVTPADIPLKIGTFPKGTIPPLAPGAGLRYNFDIANGQDLRLTAPRGETGSGLILLASLDYKDDIADHMPIAREVAFNRIEGIIVQPSAIQVKEAAGEGHAVPFSVRLDRAPTADVKIPITVADANQIVIDKTDLVFTPANWSSPQAVLVTAKDDAVKEATVTTQVRLGISESTDPRWNQMDGPDVTVSVTDDD